LKKTSDFKSIILLIVLITLFHSVVFPQKSSDKNYNVIKKDLFITTEDGIDLDCSSFIPDSTPPSRGWPCIVYCTGFGKSKNDMIIPAEEYSKYGYYTFTYSMRGQGDSKGESDLISVTEMNDLIEIIDYLKKNEEINPERIGIVGASQGGIIPFMAVCNGLYVRCIVSDLVSPSFASNWIGNGCIKMSLLWSLSYDTSIVRYSPQVVRYREWILSGEKDKWDSLQYYFPQKRDFMKHIGTSVIPASFSNSFQDMYFNANGMIKASKLLKCDYNMYFGPLRGHGSEYDNSTELFINDNFDKWIDYWLYDLNNDFKESGRISYAFSSYPLRDKNWTYSNYTSQYFPEDGLKRIKFYLHPESKLHTFPFHGIADTTSFRNEVINDKLTMEEAVNYEFVGQVFSTKFKRDSLYFDTDPLHWNYNMIGLPKLNLVYSSNAVVCQYNFQIWEVFPDNGMKFVTSVNYTDRDNRPHSKKEILLDGNSQAHIFSKGNRIRIIVTNLDTRNGNNFLRTNPFVLPVLEKSQNILYMGHNNATFIELPVKESF
jgi:predicted acyl esterase